MKKLIATALSALMALMAAATPALAADLGDFPAPFVSDSSPNFTVVVGKDANVKDVVSGLNVAARLGGETVTTTAGQASVQGGETEEVNLNTVLGNEFSTMDDNDVAGLKDTTVSWNSEDVNVEETVNVNDAKVMTYKDDDDFGADVFLGTAESSGSLVYKYILDDSDLNTSAVSSDKELEVEILGKDLTITKVYQSTDKITVQEAQEGTFGVGDTLTLDDKTVKIVSIGQNSASISVDGESEIISEESTSEVGNSDIEVDVKNILYTDDVESRQVNILAGSEVESTIEDGDSMEMFGEPTDNDDAEWVWNIDSTSGDDKLVVGAEHSLSLDSDQEDVKAVGESLAFPNDYAKVTLNKLTAKADMKFTGSFVDGLFVDKNSTGNDIGSTLDDQIAFKLKSDKDGQGFTVNATGGEDETDTVYFVENETGNLYSAFENSDGDVEILQSDQNATNPEINITYDDTTYYGTYLENTTDSPAYINFTNADSDNSENLSFHVNVENKKLGSKDEEAQSSDMLLNGKGIGSKEDALRTNWGVVIDEPKSTTGSDEVVFHMPSERVKGEVTVSGTGTTVSTGEGGRSGQVTSNIAKMDTEVSDPATAGNLIMVGGPCANLLVSKLAENNKTKSCDEWSAEDGGMVQLVNNAFADGQTALVVAGWSAEDTSAAAAKLQSAGISETLSGTKVTV